MGEDAMRHHRVTVIRPRSGPNHVGVVGSMVVTGTRSRFRFVNPGTRLRAIFNDGGLQGGDRLRRL